MFAFGGTEDGIMVGFEEIERSAALSLAKALSDVEDALNAESVVRSAEDNNEEVPEVANEDPYRRFEVNMYEAHVDHVEEKEIRQWQSAFPFYRLTGTSMKSICISEENNMGEGVVVIPRIDDTMHVVAPSPPTEINSQQFSRPHTSFKTPHKDENNLIIVGRQCEMHFPCDCVDSKEYGGDEQDGVLEEILALDCSSEDTKTNSTTGGGNRLRETGKYIPISPSACHREEVIAALTEAVWPECVEAFRPLVQRVVSVCRERGISYEDDKGQELEESSATDGEFMSLGVGKGRANSFGSDT